MPATIIDFDASNQYDSATALVYTKTRWLLDPWTLEPNLHCLEVTWATAPSLPTASFQWWYGDVAAFDAHVFSVVNRLDLAGKWVKVSVAGRNWFGRFDVEQDVKGGLSDSVAHGRQILTAYGIDKVLKDHEIISAVWQDTGGTNIVDVAPEFNANGVANMTADPHDGAHVFEGNPNDAQFWTTRKIVQYLLRYQTPTDYAGVRVLLFSLDESANANLLPDWDKPSLPQEGFSTYNLLDQLINRRRLYTWSIIHEGAADLPKVRPRTTIEVDVSVDIPMAVDIGANKKQVHLIFDSDPLTNAVLKGSAVEQVDQVVVRGARRISICTVSKEDGTLAEGWTATQETTYTAGATNAADFAAIGTKERKKRHEEVRAKPEFDPVFSLFTIPPTWDRMSAGGTGSSSFAVFPTDVPTVPYPVYYPGIAIQQTLLPLLEGVDYSGTKIADGTLVVPDKEDVRLLRPLVFLKVPDSVLEGSGTPTDRWVRAEHVGQNSDKEITDSREQNLFSVSVAVARGGKGLQLHVSGAPQHVLNAAGFSYLAEDERLGGWAYNGGMIATIAIPDDRYCEGRWPLAVSLTADLIRRKVIWAGDGWRKDYVTPGTVVGVDDDGALIRSTGIGYLPPEGTGDDEHYLIAAAKLAATYYTVERQVLVLESARLQAGFEVGDMITEIGDLSTDEPAGHRATVNTVITDLRMYFPIETPDAKEAPKLRITTGTGELDPLLMIPRERSDADDFAGLSPAGREALRKMRL